ncbi:hypothetical protein [Tenacibaculum finnmarkense]|uniref:hypothetical protein n=1 Tax=Tenacibaculum finnmarkense TaxID=2781243 RepID=UPI001E5672B0|nr:hypothetical protein [Tenacibaculum finnmarkense]MCD8423597.1 hypothetical protein [Tenacibaculum finnmarkense genomovar ulcerans]MCG8239790.1 hypothetical protein [Tenacibaculum finnmarkense genomovar ulcerans]
MSEKDKLLYQYVDYVIQNSPIDDEVFIQNRYDGYSDSLGVDDRLRDNIYSVRNILTTQGFVYLDDDMYFLTEKGQEAKRLGGYFKYLKSKRKLSRYQKWAIILSVLAIVSTISQSIYTQFIKSADDNSLQIDSLSQKYDRIIHEVDSLTQKFHTAEFDSLNVTNDSLSLTKKDSLPNK